MNYVRTRDGRILEESKCADFDKDDYADYMLGWLNEADSIEKLCDGYIIFGKERITPSILMPLYAWTFEKAKEHAIHEKTDLYACIWVFDDNGAPTLKPVAKMNEKEELELL